MKSPLRLLLLMLLGAITVSTAVAQSRRQPPYWASISSGRAMMRAGPARTYPGTWLYVRADLPVRVIEVYQSWRKIQDPDGTTGWMLVNLLSDQRTGLVTGDGPRPMHARPDLASPVRFRAAPGVVGRISRCREGWCRFEVGSRDGYIRADHIWGLGRNEQVD
jgi:SH3-like domain-containing protein